MEKTADLVTKSELKAELETRLETKFDHKLTALEERLGQRFEGRMDAREKRQHPDDGFIARIAATFDIGRSGLTPAHSPRGSRCRYTAPAPS